MKFVALTILGCLLAVDEPTTPQGWERLGSEAFVAGRFDDSVAAFDREIELDARRAPWHWKRGISLYYAGRYAEGAKQFEGYQSVDGNDVENAVWRFLCQAKDPEIGIDRARREMLTIKDDRRVPMRQIYQMFQGELRPDDVLAAVEVDPPSAQARSARLFYARLYLGLYYDVLGDERRALEQLEDAVRHKIDHYMGEVAVVHAGQLRSKLGLKK